MLINTPFAILFFSLISFILIYIVTINSYYPYEEIVSDIYRAQTFTARDIEYAQTMMSNAHFKMSAILTFIVTATFLGTIHVFKDAIYPDNETPIRFVDNAMNLFDQ